MTISDGFSLRGTFLPRILLLNVFFIKKRD